MFRQYVTSSCSVMTGEGGGGERESPGSMLQLNALLKPFGSQFLPWSARMVAHETMVAAVHVFMPHMSQVGTQVLVPFSLSSK